MSHTSTRLLRLLSLLQVRKDWSGADLADRLGVTTRTVRRDVDRLRDLGYPVHATVGVGGGYQLGAGAHMPPLLLDDSEVLAVAIGLRSGATGSVEGLDGASARAVAKLRQVMPSRLRHRLDSLDIDTRAPRRAPGAVSSDALTTIAAACHHHEHLRFDYVSREQTTSRREVEPHRLVRDGQRWYLLAWDPTRSDWRTFRVDRISVRSPNGARFTPRRLPEGGAAEFVARGIGAAFRVHAALIRIHLPLEQIVDRLSDEWAQVEASTETSCDIRFYGKDASSIARWLSRWDADFTVLQSDEVREACSRLAYRYHQAVATEPAS